MRRFVWLGLCLLALSATQAVAVESTPIATTRATASLMTDTDTIAPGRPFRLGLRLSLAPGWHTYWQNPGEAGIPPSLDLQLPPGFQAGPIAWPAPERLVEGPLIAYGYTGSVLLPLTITPPPALTGPLTLAATAHYLVCEQICVPEEAQFTLLLPAGSPAPSAQAALFAATPIPAPSPWSAQIAPNGILSVQGVAPVQEAWFFPSQTGRIVPSAPEVLRNTPNGFRLSLQPDTAFDPAADLSGVLTIRQSGKQHDLSLLAKPGPAPLDNSLPRLLLLAFAGGLILNAMPCVFPVLAMKALGLARLSGGAQRDLRRHALSYTAGVVLTFLALGVILLALRQAGLAAGWGFQFQSPIFVAAMAWLLFGVGLNLSGVFQIGGSLTGAGQNLAARSGHAGSFFTGLLAALVATPCTAPFMGVAIAAALAAPAATELGVFLTMGLGLATPYVLLAVFPGAARLLPRPGRWMEILRQGLAFPMYAASAWLLWVVNQEAGSSGVLGTASGLVLLGFAAWTFGLAQTAGSRHARRFGQAAAFAAIVATLAVLPGIGAGGGQAEIGAEAFSPTRLAALQAEGRPVFVNMTAAWCVTCLVNERVALSPAAVQRAFADHNVAYLKGDWTRQDPQITAFLRQEGREGVPLYLLYRPGEPAPTILPQILTEQTVLQEVGRSKPIKAPS